MAGSDIFRIREDAPKYITGIDDDTGVGDGSNVLLFNLGTGNGNRKVPMEFSERVYIRTVSVAYVDAPFGAKFVLLIRRRSDSNLLRILINDVPIYGTGQQTFRIERGKVPATTKLQAIVLNSTGTAPHDPAAAFKVVASIGLDRETVS